MDETVNRSAPNTEPVQSPAKEPVAQAVPGAAPSVVQTPPPYTAPQGYPTPPAYGVQSMNQPPYPGYAPCGPPRPGAYPPQPRPERRRFKGRDYVMAALIALFCFIMTDCFIWTGTLGAGFAVGAVLILVTVLWFERPYIRRVGFYTVACIVLFIAGGATLAFSADSVVKALVLFGLWVLYVCIIMDSMQLRVHTPGVFASIGDFFYTAFATSFGKIGAGMYGLFHCEKKDGKTRRAGFGKALLGLLIALPVAIVLLVLLYHADDAFHGMLNSFDLGELPERVLSLFVMIPLFILLFCQLFSLRDVRRQPREESDRGIDPIILTFFLLGVSAVYLVYLFSQLAYFFSGFGGFLPEDFTYAEYARRGFFELTAVSVINILIVILGSAFSRKRSGKLPLKVRLPLLFLCLFSLMLVATEVAKMKMYMDRFGLTRLRILTTVFMIFLAIVFIALIVYLFARRFPYLKVAVIAGVALAITLNFVSVDRMVAEYNVWAYQNGVLRSVDVDTITELGDAAVPSLLKLADDDDPAVADAAKTELLQRWCGLHEITIWNEGDGQYEPGALQDYDWRGFNLTSYRARQLLLDNESVFMSETDTAEKAAGTA